MAVIRQEGSNGDREMLSSFHAAGLEVRTCDSHKNIDIDDDYRGGSGYYYYYYGGSFCDDNYCTNKENNNKDKIPKY